MLGCDPPFVFEGRRKLHSEELHNLYSSSDIITVIKPRRMVWDGLVASTKRIRKHNFLNPAGRCWNNN
jgi:hypothetical protein